MSSKQSVYCLWYQTRLDQWVFEGIYCDRQLAQAKLEKLKKKNDIIDSNIDLKYVRYTS